MILGWDQTKPPDLPSKVDVDVTGCASVLVRIHEPIEGAITTKFKGMYSKMAKKSNESDVFCKIRAKKFINGYEIP